MVLEFHKQIFESCFDNDGLVVVANGMGVYQVILGFLKLYSDSSDLVLFIDVESNESLQNSFLFYTERLLSFGIKPAALPTLINQEHSASKSNLYKKGGVYFSQASIFVLDFLTRRIPIDMVSGIIINNAHCIGDSSTEHLLIKLFREHNKTGFIKAFTTSPHQLSNEMGKLQRVMKHLHVTKVFLWPRFHQTVSSVLDAHSPDMNELQVPPTEKATRIVHSIQRAIQELFDRLKTKTKISTGSDGAGDSAITDFEGILQTQIKPKWASLDNSSKQLVANIKLLRSLLANVLSYDCVTFYGLLLNIQKSFEKEHPDSDDLNMIFGSKETETLYKLARERVYRTNVDKKTGQVVNVPVLDPNPKWILLYQILKEIEEENRGSEAPGNTIVFTRDEKTTQQLQSYLHLGDQQFLKAKYAQFLERYRGQIAEANTRANVPNFRFSNRNQVKSNRKQQISETNNLKKKRLKQDSSGSHSLFDMGVGVIDSSTTRTGGVGVPQPRVVDLPMAEDGGMDIEQMINSSNFAEFYSLIPPPYVIIHPGSVNIFDEVRPKFIVLYDPDIKLMRMIEIYKAENPGTPVKVYFVTYSNSSEEAYYMSALYRERTAFERLIREKTLLVFDQKDDTPMVDIEKLELLRPGEATNSRTGGTNSRLALFANTRKRVIIDSFEFKSALPVVLHNKGFEIVPLRLEIGDYVITPSIAIERKSLSDLIGSFLSGRLYTQIEAMSRAYANPILLIEFDMSLPFYLASMDEIRTFTPTYSPLNSLITKLNHLIIAFPKLRILWSRSPYSTANIYDRIKQGHQEPEPESIAQVPETNEEQYNYAAQDILKSMPGVTNENVKSIMDNVESIHELSKLSLSQLKSILKNDLNANLLYDYLNS